MSAYKEVALQQAQRLKDEYQRFRSSQTSAPAPAPTQDGVSACAALRAVICGPMRSAIHMISYGPLVSTLWQHTVRNVAVPTALRSIWTEEAAPQPDQTVKTQAIHA